MIIGGAHICTEMNSYRVVVIVVVVIPAGMMVCRKPLSLTTGMCPLAIPQLFGSAVPVSNLIKMLIIHPSA